MINDDVIFFKFFKGPGDPPHLIEVEVDTSDVESTSIWRRSPSTQPCGMR